MNRRTLGILLLAAACWFGTANPAQAQQAYGQQYSRTYNTQDWGRFNHYPYVYYPHNYYGEEYYRSHEDLYHRYAPEMQIPVYNRKWHNYYPQQRKYHRGHHFVLDVF